MLLFLILLLVVAIYLQQKMGVHALKYLRGELDVDSQLVDPGEPVTMIVRLENRGRFPILYLKTSVSLPRETEMVDGSVHISEIYHLKKYVFACYLLPGQRLERRVKISFPKRGVWHLGGMQLAAGDLLGIREDCESRNVHALVVAAPARISDMDAQSVIGGLMGDQSVRRWIHEDPILSAGYREYTGREPQRSIAWAKSLASGQMMVRNYDHTTDQRVRVILLLQENTPAGRQEDCFSSVRTLCQQLEQDSIPYSFVSNGELYSFLGNLERVENGLGQNHLNRIFESLGRAGYGVRFSANEMIRREILSSDPVQGYLLIIAEQCDEISALARQLEIRTEAAVRMIQAPRGSHSEAEDAE